MKRFIKNIATEREYEVVREKGIPVSQYYGENTFSFTVMHQKLPSNTCKKLMRIIKDGEKLDPAIAETVAHAMKEWAIEKGATHFCHWFQPMTGATAEKHDSFLEFTKYGEPIERFSAEMLVKGEPDASSFPSGGLRTTFEARGYTAWDPSSPAFILNSGIGSTLCIPSVFLSYTGEALDKKTPLLRSLNAINNNALRLMRLLGNDNASRVISTLGAEQEYFLIDMDYYYKRPDLVLTGRALLGAAPTKGQQLEDHYFGSIKERILSYMHDVEEVLYKLGIPAKTRHNEVAPSQFEIAPIFEEANIAVDHNHIIMETLRRVAQKHRLAALLHEKPFAGINGSGKHCNWSLSDNLGNNLLNPGHSPQDNVQFLVFLTATIRAMYHHADLLRASVAYSGNDHRLGANEAPPAIISVFLGEQLTKILSDIEQGVISKATNKAIIDLGLSTLPVVSKDNTDRNRTSPFAFTGNKFEFRAVGASQSIAFPVTIINTIVAESIDVLAGKIETRSGDVRQAAIDVIREEISAVKPILFMGDNYSKEWEDEAQRRGLQNRKVSVEALPQMVSEKSVNLFKKYGVLSPVELEARYTIRLERYIKEMDIEAKTMLDMVQTKIIPACMRYQQSLASSCLRVAELLGSAVPIEAQKQLCAKVAMLNNEVIAETAKLGTLIEKASQIHDELKKAQFYAYEIKGQMTLLRNKTDSLETIASDDLWPFPRFWEMLFII